MIDVIAREIGDVGGEWAQIGMVGVQQSAAAADSLRLQARQLVDAVMVFRLR
jgi:hypothetical protein